MPPGIQMPSGCRVVWSTHFKPSAIIPCGTWAGVMCCNKQAGCLLVVKMIILFWWIVEIVHICILLFLYRAMFFSWGSALMWHETRIAVFGIPSWLHRCMFMTYLLVCNCLTSPIWTHFPVQLLVSHLRYSNKCLNQYAVTCFVNLQPSFAGTMNTQNMLYFMYLRRKFNYFKLNLL